MRKWSSFIFMAAALLFGCSGGGSSSGAGIEPQAQSFQMGLVRGDTTTTVVLPVIKPFYPEATVELAEAPTGAFRPAAGMLPANLAPGPDAPLWVTFTPPPAPAAAQQEGTIRLLFRRVSGGQPVLVTVQLYAQVETPSVRLERTELSAGNVVVGETKRFGVYVENTSVATPITVTSVTPPEGDFSIPLDAFPVPCPVAPGSKFFVRLQYAPQQLGSSFSFIRVYHSGSEHPLEATLTGTGVEKPSVRLVQTDVSAGEVVVGETVELGVYVENTSVMTPITVTDVALPEGEFSISPDASALPAEVAPGAMFRVPLVYAPQGTWDATAVLTVHHTAGSQPLEATLTGTGIAPRLYYTYDVSLDVDTGESVSWQELEVPAGAVGIFLEATGDPLSVIDLIGLEGPGVVYENSDMNGPLGWLANYPAGGRGYLTIELPNSGHADVQLVPGGGTYRFLLRDAARATDTLQVRVTISQRTTGTVEVGTIDIRVFLADGLGINPYDAMSDAKLAEVMKTIDAIFGMSDIRLGNIWFIPMEASYDTLADETATDDMIANNTLYFGEGALNLFFVTDMTYGIAGIAGAVPGPATNGTPYSGVVIDFGEADGITVGATAAHEMGHYLGHHDDPGSEGWLLTTDEAYPVLRHPLLNPGLPQDFLSPPDATFEALILAAIEEMPAMDTACGTCTRSSARPQP